MSRQCQLRGILSPQNKPATLQPNRVVFSSSAQQQRAWTVLRTAAAQPWQVLDEITEAGPVLTARVTLVDAERGVDPEAVAEAYHAFEQGSSMAPLTAAAISNQTIQESMRLLLLVRAYQVTAFCMSVLYLTCVASETFSSLLPECCP